MTSKTEGRALADAQGLPMQVMYDRSSPGGVVGQQVTANLAVSRSAVAAVHSLSRFQTPWPDQ